MSKIWNPAIRGQNARKITPSKSKHINEKWNSLLYSKNIRDNKVYGKITFGSPNAMPRKDVLDVNMDESVTEFSLPRSTNKSNTTDENIEEIAEGGLWIWGQVFDADIQSRGFRVRR